MGGVLVVGSVWAQERMDEGLGETARVEEMMVWWDCGEEIVGVQKLVAKMSMGKEKEIVQRKEMGQGKVVRMRDIRWIGRGMRKMKWWK